MPFFIKLFLHVGFRKKKYSSVKFETYFQFIDQRNCEKQRSIGGLFVFFISVCVEAKVKDEVKKNFAVSVFSFFSPHKSQNTRIDFSLMAA